VDECATGEAGCHEHATCSNGKPGYTCLCDSANAYFGDGKQCTLFDIPKGFNVLSRVTYAQLEIAMFDSDSFNERFRTDFLAAVAAEGKQVGGLELGTCVPGLLGSFLWYRPGLCQCRFRIAIRACLGLNRHIFSASAGLGSASTVKTASHQPLLCTLPVQVEPGITALHATIHRIMSGSVVVESSLGFQTATAAQIFSARMDGAPAEVFEAMAAYGDIQCTSTTHEVLNSAYVGAPNTRPPHPLVAPQRRPPVLRACTGLRHRRGV
jgi:hypothetical protein